MRSIHRILRLRKYQVNPRRNCDRSNQLKILAGLSKESPSCKEVTYALILTENGRPIMDRSRFDEIIFMASKVDKIMSNGSKGFLIFNPSTT